ncbi:MAG TPA: YlbF family regulator [Bacillota bacterium]|nr:YlbF family regulator [Bacillota bacterium]
MGNQGVVTSSTIVDKAKELAEMIASTNEVEFYKKAEEQISGNVKVQTLIAEIKKKQKEAVYLEHIGRADLIKKVEEEIDLLQDELDAIPVVLEFKQSQLEINDLLQMVTNVIANTVTDKIIVSTGGDPLSGETGFTKVHPEGSEGGCGCGH